MQVKKFEAPTIQEALETIKRELGPEAIILQTKKHKGGFGLMSKGSVEVTAAVSERSIQKKKYVETRLPEDGRETLNSMTAERQAAIQNKMYDRYSNSRGAGATVAAPQKKLTATRYADIDVESMPVFEAPAPVAAAIAKKPGMPVEEELKHLKRMIEELKNAQDTELAGGGAQALINHKSNLQVPALHDAFEQLVVNGVDKRYALGIIKRVGFELGDEKAASPDAVLDQLAAEVMQNIDVESPLARIRANEGAGPQVVALVGPTGVGKTTTVAKIASEALLRRNLKVGLINLDSYKIAAFDQLGTYAKILNVPFRSVGNADDLRAAIQDFQSLDLILVDTTGRSQRDPSSLKEMHDLLKEIPNVQTHLALSATTRDTELYDMAHRFGIFSPQGLVISKLDEATIYGSIYNLAQKVKLPLVYFTTGQRVPEDIEEATRERVAALVLDI